MILLRSLFITLLSICTATAVPFMAGTAKVDITPTAEEAVNLAGQKVALRDPLYARVLVLKSHEAVLAIVSVDLLVFASAKVVEEAKAKWGVTHVILSSTHTHATMAARGMHIHPPDAPDWTRSGKAPEDSIDWPGLSSDPWYAATEAKVVAAIGEATHALFPARLITGKGPIESAYMAHNRRLVRPDGGVTALWENPDRRPTQPVDPTVGVLRVEDLAGRPRALAVQYACHPVALMSAGVISRDYPGAVVDYVEQQLGPQCMGMFLQGASGDLDPYDLHNLRGENRFNIVQQAGISLAKSALALSAKLKTDPEATQSFAARGRLLRLGHRSDDETTEVEILSVMLNGDFVLVAIPGEPFVQHQLDLTKASPVPNTLILGLAYSGQGTPFTVYIPTAQAVKEGGYGAAECSFLEAGAGAKIVADVVKQLHILVADHNLGSN